MLINVGLEINKIRKSVNRCYNAAKYIQVEWFAGLGSRCWGGGGLQACPEAIPA